MVTSVQNETFDDLGREINGIHFNKDGTISKNIEKEDEELFNSVIDFKSNKWTLIDLKNLEKSSWIYKIESKSLKDYMYRFDYLILTPASKQTELNYKK